MVNKSDTSQTIQDSRKYINTVTRTQLKIIIIIIINTIKQAVTIKWMVVKFTFKNDR